MKRVLLSVVTAGALLFGGLLSSARADHRHHHHGHHHHVPVVRNYCAPIGYGYGYNGCNTGWNSSYYGGCGPRVVPYGAGYIGGYQPYQQLQYSGRRFVISVGF
jgi:hypothetical protein